MTNTKEIAKQILGKALEAKEQEEHWCIVWSDSDELDDFAYTRSLECFAECKAYLDCYEMITGHSITGTSRSIRKEMELIA